MKVTHSVDEDGRVFCPKEKKSVDLLRCYGCVRLVEIDVDTKHPHVSCDMDRPETQGATAR
jgi:hypothetical protein